MSDMENKKENQVPNNNCSIAIIPEYTGSVGLGDLEYNDTSSSEDMKNQESTWACPDCEHNNNDKGRLYCEGCGKKCSDGAADVEPDPPLVDAQGNRVIILFDEIFKWIVGIKLFHLVALLALKPTEYAPWKHPKETAIGCWILFQYYIILGVIYLANVFIVNFLYDMNSKETQICGNINKSTIYVFACLFIMVICVEISAIFSAFLFLCGFSKGPLNALQITILPDGTEINTTKIPRKYKLWCFISNTIPQIIYVILIGWYGLFLIIASPTNHIIMTNVMFAGCTIGWSYLSHYIMVPQYAKHIVDKLPALDPSKNVIFMFISLIGTMFGIIIVAGISLIWVSIVYSNRCGF